MFPLMGRSCTPPGEKVIQIQLGQTEGPFQPRMRILPVLELVWPLDSTVTWKK